MGINSADHQAGSVVELVVFALKEGVTQDQFLATHGAASQWVRAQPGFIGEDLTYATNEDRWIEIVRWQTLNEAQAAAQAAETDPACGPMFALIDMDNMLFLHGVPAATAVIASN
jgi:antibiotic biosynthesis monooxygenase (ABM) superfamily enzyme